MVVNNDKPQGEQRLNSELTEKTHLYDSHMTPTQLVLASVGLGIVTGALIMILVFTARSAGQRRAEQLRPELSQAARDVLQELSMFAVVLDASLSPVYANPAARNDARITGEQLRDPDFLRRARQVMATGVTDVRDPDPNLAGDTVRVKIFRLQHKFLVVFAIDLGEEQRLNTMRRDFIANVSHELKTPIAALSLLSEAVQEAAEEPEIVRGFAKSMRKESRRLTELSRDIIQLSEAQTTLRPEDREPVNLVSVIHTEVEAHQEFAAQHGVEIVVHDAPAAALAPVTLGRPSSIGTVIANLLTNAIRHSPDGGRVGVGIEVDAKATRITVTDQGEGIDAEHLPRIFERFYRVDNARSREGGGTGLGLSIARHTMQAHGGDIDVWSQPGLGSSFTLTFPLLEPTKVNKKHGNTSKSVTKRTKGVAS